MSGQLGFHVEFETPLVTVFFDHLSGDIAHEGPNLSALADRWIDLVEDLGLSVGGGWNGKSGGSFFITTPHFFLLRNRTEADRDQVFAWLRDQPEVTFAMVGPLVEVE